MLATAIRKDWGRRTVVQLAALGLDRDLHRPGG